jgi:hypothetical protein
MFRLDITFSKLIAAVMLVLSFVLSSPLLSNRLNVPDPVFELIISQRIFEFDPEDNEPEAPSILEPELFIITPSEIVSSENEAEVEFK